MLKPGDHIEATVSATPHFGIFASHEGAKVFVPITEVSWVASPTVLEGYTVGQAVDVLILRRDPDRGWFIGSIRRLYQSANPYWELHGAAARAETLTGVIEGVLPSGARIRLPNGAAGYCPGAAMGVGIRPGETVRVRVRSMDAAEGRLELEMV